VDLLVLKTQLRGDLPDPGNGPQAPGAGIADDEEHIGFADGAPADMLHAGLRVDHDEAVIPLKLLHALREEVVRKTVAAGALGPAHGDKIESFGLNQRLPEPEPDIIVAVHAGRDVAREGLLPHAPEGFLHRDAQRLVEVGIRVGIHREHRGLFERNERADQEGTDRCLASSSFSGEGDGERAFAHCDFPGHAAPGFFARIRREISAAAPMIASDPAWLEKRIPQLGVMSDWASKSFSGIRDVSCVRIARYFS